MPKVNLGRDTRNENLKAIIAAGMARRGLSSKKDLARHCQIKDTTMYYRFNHPDTFDIGELRRIFDFLRIPAEERQGVL